MSISTVLLSVFGLGVAAEALAVWAVWRRLQALSGQVNVLNERVSQCAASVPDSLSSSPPRQGADSEHPAGAGDPHRLGPGGHRVASFALITDKPASGEAEPDPRDLDLSVARVASVTLAEPLVKVSAFAHGVRHALDEEQRMRVSATFRRELRRQHKVRRRQRASRARAERRSHAGADGPTA